MYEEASRVSATMRQCIPVRYAQRLRSLHTYIHTYILTYVRQYFLLLSSFNTVIYTLDINTFSVYKFLCLSKQKKLLKNNKFRMDEQITCALALGGLSRANQLKK